MASTDLTHLDGFVAKAYYLDSTSYTICSSGGAITAPTGVTVTSGGLTVTAGGVTVTAGGVGVTAGDVAFTAGGVRVPVTSYTTTHNGTTMVGYGLVRLSSANTTGSTMVMPTISTASSALGVSVKIQLMGGTTGAWSISFPANHLVSGSTYNHLAFSTATTGYAHIELMTASSLTYAVLGESGIAMSTT
jgi:hypothetical protein